MEKTIADWIYAMLITKAASITVQDEAIRFRLNRGCPQRAVLSPTVVASDGRVTQCPRQEKGESASLCIQLCHLSKDRVGKGSF